MNKKKTIWKPLFVFVAAMMTFAVSSCSLDNEEGGLELYYAAISDIGPTMTYTINAPSYQGATPSQFAVSTLKLEDAVVENASFVINEETGSISIENTDALAVGLYKLSITCVAGAKTHSFPDIITVNMLSATPTEIKITPAVLEIPFDGIKNSKLTAQVELIGESVSIARYSLVQEEGKEFFAISGKGVIGVNSKYDQEFIPGEHKITLTLATAAGGVATYKDSLLISITSTPMELTYTPKEAKMEVNGTFTSSTPVLKGSLDELVYAIKAITPSTDKITIDAVTGVLSVAENNGLPVGTEYLIDITATNKYGALDFAGAYKLFVIAFIAPIVSETFKYAADTEVTQGVAFTITKNIDFEGDEVTYEFVELLPALEGQIIIDPQTGTITANKGNSIPVASYDIQVKAKNVKSEAITTLKLIIKANPNHFTYISYGNNIGLTPAGDYANQFRFNSEGDFANGLTGVTPTTDATVALTWSIDVKIPQKWTEDLAVPKSPLNYPCQGTTINPATGVITLSGFEANTVGVVFVTATAGEGNVGEVSVTIPVFFAFTTAVEGALFHYTPFVLQVNPQTGGRSTAPTITGVLEMPKLLMDYRRDFEYYNINGPDSHKDGRPQTTSTTVVPFLKNMWDKYKNDNGGLPTVNHGSKAPLSYYLNYAGYTGKAGTNDPQNALAYIDPVTFAVIVNPNKWILDGAYANGVLSGQMIFQINGVAKDINKGKTVNLVWIWFDEKF